jgi:hypothetical protein
MMKRYTIDIEIIYMYKLKMNLFPFLLLGLIVLPESIINVPIFPFISQANAYPINHHAQSNAVDAVVGERASLECDACLILAKGVNQTVLHNPKVISIVSTDLEKMCQVLPASVQQLCLGAAEQTAPLLLNHLGDLIATEGCYDLGICHSSAHPYIRVPRS